MLKSTEKTVKIANLCKFNKLLVVICAIKMVLKRLTVDLHMLYVHGTERNA